MVEIFYVSQKQAAEMTTFKELMKLYKRKGKRFEEAFETNRDRYDTEMEKVLATKEESSEELVAA